MLLDGSAKNNLSECGIVRKLMRGGGLRNVTLRCHCHAMQAEIKECELPDRTLNSLFCDGTLRYEKVGKNCGRDKFQIQIYAPHVVLVQVSMPSHPLSTIATHFDGRQRERGNSCATRMGKLIAQHTMRNSSTFNAQLQRHHKGDLSPLAFFVRFFFPLGAWHGGGAFGEKQLLG